VNAPQNGACGVKKKAWHLRQPIQRRPLSISIRWFSRFSAGLLSFGSGWRLPVTPLVQRYWLTRFQDI